MPVLALAGCSGGAPGGQDASFADAIGSDQGAVDFCTKLFGDPNSLVKYASTDDSKDSYYWQATRRGQDGVECLVISYAQNAYVMDYSVYTADGDVPPGNFVSRDGKYRVSPGTMKVSDTKKAVEVARRAADHIK